MQNQTLNTTHGTYTVTYWLTFLPTLSRILPITISHWTHLDKKLILKSWMPVSYVLMHIIVKLVRSLVDMHSDLLHTFYVRTSFLMHTTCLLFKSLYKPIAVQR